MSSARRLQPLLRSGRHPRARRAPPHSPVDRKRESNVSPRTVFSPYAQLFTVPGTRAFSSAGLVARVPMTTAGLG